MHCAPDLADRIDALLPQTQCRRCGYDGCRPYAEAIAQEAADINRCPPGGETTLAALARLLAREAPPLDTSRGLPGPLRIARIDEAACIGCTLCIAACPVDAIVGAQKRMHGVLAALCSGCELCLPACPVDCIEMIPAARHWSPIDAVAARERFAQRSKRLDAARLAARRDAEARKRKDAIDAALARARARRNPRVAN
jgi:Na+-translocating ferredoxin:NAD+ oxidoreductase subunit B